jgi:hypothetical protein
MFFELGTSQRIKIEFGYFKTVFKCIMNEKITEYSKKMNYNIEVGVVSNFSSSFAKLLGSPL